MNSEAHKSILNLSDEIGAFIQYWGFKSIHGRVWALIFLSNKPIDANYLIENLNVSKSLISMTLKELIDYNVIFETEKNGPTLCYQPNMKIKDVIFDVLAKREAMMLLKIKAACNIVNKTPKKSLEDSLSDKRLEQLSSMVNTAESSLKAVLSLKEVNFLPIFKKLNLKD